MTNIDACKHVVANGVSLVRYRKNSATADAVPQYDVKGFWTGNKRGWMALDALTASAIVALYDALAKTQTPENLAKIYRLPWDKLASFAFKHVR